jgi:hypothetical protein
MEGVAMTLEQWAYVGEIIAAIAVIASLIYVAKELHQNTNVMRVNNADNFVNFNVALCNPVATDRVFAELWIKGWSDFESLDAVDRQRLIIFEWQAISAWHNWFNLRQQALVSDAQWAELTGIFGNLGKRQSIRESWKSFKDIYDTPFQRFIAQYLEPRG